MNEEDGFGYSELTISENRNNIKTMTKYLGGVHIGRNVDIGANTCIDRGNIANTIISAYTKIDKMRRMWRREPKS